MTTFLLTIRNPTVYIFIMCFIYLTILTRRTVVFMTQQNNGQAGHEDTRAFKIKMVSDQYATAEKAFLGMIKTTEEKEMFNIFLVKSRGFKRTFRPAQISLEDFIQAKAEACKPPQPIVCIRDVDGWIFCGSVALSSDKV